MILTSLLGPTSAARKVAVYALGALLLIVACLACAWGGYRHGRSTATAEGDAKYARLEASHAAALAEANAKALDRYSKETERADTAAAALLSTRRSLDSTRTRILKEIPHANLGACSLGPGFLRLYAQALGYGAGAVPAAAPAGGAAGDAAAPAAAGPRLR